MPAARGGSPKAAPQTSSRAGKAAPGSKSRAPAAGKGAAAPARHGLSPKWALLGAGVILMAALGVTLATGHRGEKIAQGVRHGIDGRFGAAGFRLRTVHVEGASPMATADIVRAAGVYKDQPLLGLDLEAVRGKVESVGWVKEARVVRLLPDTLMLAVQERRQLAVWQHGGRSRVIDAHGRVIPEAEAARFPSLPLVVGEGAAEHAPEILPILAAHPRMMTRMDALIRVDNRRWDLRLKDGSLIQLPAVDEDQALNKLEDLDQGQRILELGFDRIDLRNPGVVAVRPRPPSTTTAQAPVAATGA